MWRLAAGRRGSLASSASLVRDVGRHGQATSPGSHESHEVALVVLTDEPSWDLPLTKTPAWTESSHVFILPPMVDDVQKGPMRVIGRDEWVNTTILHVVESGRLP